MKLGTTFNFFLKTRHVLFSLSVFGNPCNFNFPFLETGADPDEVFSSSSSSQLLQCSELCSE